ncbi:aminopeptidase [Chlamydia sp. 17-3921]|uniref:aminopeptidase n=1 Tax=Chlamydia sp. 17-3921 TaxID=2675798 RepID=UPI001918641D|nr:aminopeptidase [Chlamydia sp. 17-3921]
MISKDLNQKLANILINYSLNVQPGDHVWLKGDVSGLPLLTCLHQNLIEIGAFVDSDIGVESWNEHLARFGREEQLAFAHAVGEFLATKCNKVLEILSTTNIQMLHGLPPKRLALINQSRQNILKKILNRAASHELDWTLSMLPCAAYAQEAQMSLEAFQELFYKACFLDAPDPIAKWQELSKQHETMIRFLETKTRLHIKTPNIELFIHIENMKWKNCDGKRNFPDGEIFTGPNLKAHCGGVNGRARFLSPVVFAGVVIEDIQLTFKKGRVVAATAKTNQDFLLTMLDIDEGARNVGKIAIGTNSALKQITKNIFLDEKVGKTFHLALGTGDPETGNTNVSALHWNLIGDLNEGSMFADDICFYQNGQFLFEGWPCL